MHGFAIVARHSRDMTMPHIVRHLQLCLVSNEGKDAALDREPPSPKRVRPWDISAYTNATVALERLLVG